MKLIRALIAGLLRFPAKLLAIPVLVLVGAALLVPLAYAWGADGVGDVVHTILGPLCHQLPERSLHVFAHPIGICSRCFALYASFAAVMVLLPARGLLADKLPTVPVWVVVVAAIPMAIDGFTQMFGWRESNNVLRVITGVLLGVAAAAFVAIAVNRSAKESTTAYSR